jgi:hypothetical protein
MDNTKVIIAGSGFAGLYAAMHFDKRLAGRAGAGIKSRDLESVARHSARPPRFNDFLPVTASHEDRVDHDRFDHSTVRFRSTEQKARSPHQPRRSGRPPTIRIKGAQIC